MDLSGIITTIAHYRDDLLGHGNVNADTRARNRASASGAAELANEGVKPLPESVVKLLAVLKDPNFCTRDAISALEHDPALAAEVVHLANSAANARKAPCDTVEMAFRRLGARAVGDLAIAAHVMNLNAYATGFGRNIAEHSVRVANILRWLPAFRGYSPQRLFLCGLVHDLGATLLDQSGEFHYSEMKHFDDADQSAAEIKKLGFDHATLGAIAMKMWDVPDPVSRIIAWHHDLDLAIERGGDVAYMVATLALAEAIEEAVGLECHMTQMVANNIAGKPQSTFLGITGDDILLIWETGLADDLKSSGSLVT